MTGAEDQERPPSRNRLLQPVRLLLHWMIKIVVLLFLAIRFVFRPRLVRFGLVAMVALGVVGWYLLAGVKQGPQVLGARTSTLPVGGTLSVPAAAQLPPPAVVESYLKAQANFDARGMWQAISDELKQSMNATDVSPQQLQTELDGARQQGRRYLMATYVGGVPMSEGRNVYFYVLTVSTPRGDTDVPYIYVVGTDGKIVSIQ